MDLKDWPHAFTVKNHQNEGRPFRNVVVKAGNRIVLEAICVKFIVFYRQKCRDRPFGLHSGGSTFTLMGNLQQLRDGNLPRATPPESPSSCRKTARNPTDKYVWVKIQNCPKSQKYWNIRFPRIFVISPMFPLCSLQNDPDPDPPLLPLCPWTQWKFQLRRTLTLSALNDF